jgi:macrolide transport system ATP-binding/permease protein
VFGVKRSLTVLFPTSAVLLLIACAKLANLLLARADRGEAAIRAALGASARRLMRQSMVEGVLLAVAGGVAGVLISFVGTRALIALAFPGTTFVPVTASRPTASRAARVRSTCTWHSARGVPASCEQ